MKRYVTSLQTRSWAEKHRGSIPWLSPDPQRFPGSTLDRSRNCQKLQPPPAPVCMDYKSLRAKWWRATFEGSAPCQSPLKANPGSYPIIICARDSYLELHGTEQLRILRIPPNSTHTCYPSTSDVITPVIHSKKPINL